MNVLIIGSGGREHALAWKVAQSARVENIYVAPGNAGTQLETKVQNVDIDATDINALIKFALSQHISLTIVGPEAPLVAGIVDEFQKNELRCFGPSQSAARLEGSKIFCKKFLERHNIPTGSFKSFSQIDEAVQYLQQCKYPIVIKVDGLAAGKGVYVVSSVEDATTAVSDILSKRIFGNAGQQIIIEEYLVGEEVSYTVMVDGINIVPFATSQDHKARDENDKGPNTGGMGAYSPAAIVTPQLNERIMQEVIIPTVKGMAMEGHTYTGILYAGLMISPTGVPNVLEFNVRLGDPETQPLLMRLESDLVDLFQATIDKKLDQIQAEWNSKYALGVVLAAGGYPGSYKKGDTIYNIPVDNPISKTFHAGTTLQEGNLVTNGGRVLCVVALGENISTAKTHAYNVLDKIHWDGMYYRKDIGYRAIARES